MAPRIINFDHVNTPDNATLHDVLGPNSNASQALVTRRNNDTKVYEVVPRHSFDDTDLRNVTKVTPMQSDLVDGGVKSELITQDMALYHRYFLSEFPTLHNSQALIGDNDDWIKLINFPLPEFAMIHGEKRYYKIETDNIVIVTADYPDFPPKGVHFHENSPNIEIFDAVLNTHIFSGVTGVSDGYKRDISQLENRGWRWMCFHHEDFKWNFNLHDIKAGDGLYKYIEMLFARLAGAQVH